MVLINFISVVMVILGLIAYYKTIVKIMKNKSDHFNTTGETLNVIPKTAIATVSIFIWMLFTSTATNHINTTYMTNKAKPYSNSVKFNVNPQGEIKNLTLQPKTEKNREDFINNNLTARDEVKKILSEGK